MLPAETARHRFTAEEYRKMGEVGILHEDDRVELIGGEIVDMAAIGTRHLACVVVMNHLLVPLSGGRYFVSVQNPISVGPGDEPQPDIVLLKERPRPDAEAPPSPGDVLLVVEVSDTALAYDRNVKLPLYAHAGILEVWIVDLRGEVVTRYSGPERGGYGSFREHGRGEEITSGTVPGLTLAVDDVLGR